MIARFTRCRPLAPASHECNVWPLRADVAQLVEQRFRKPQVTGSNPVVGFLVAWAHFHK
jgi:hypothetical protein